MVPIVAVMGVVLLGMSALAVDLSLNTQNRRGLQNVTDAAALAGARNLPNTPKQALKDALDVLQRNSPWSGNSTWLATAQAAITGTCTSAAGSTCTVSVAGPSGYTGYTVKASSPPSTPQDSNYSSTSYLEVELVQNSGNAFGGAAGIGSSNETGHSIAYYAGPTGPYQYAFFAKVHAGSGNHAEQIIGDAFVGGGYVPQSSGKAGLCVTDVPGGGQGHVVFGSVPPLVGPDPQYSNGGVCSGGGTLSAQAATPQSSAPTNCPSGSTPQSYNGGANWACYQPNPALPAIPAPTPTQSALCGTNGSATVDATTTAGVYPVGAGCAVTIDFSSGNINCVSLVLGAGSTVTTYNKKSTNYISAYGFNPTGDTVASSTLTAAGLPVPGASCGGAAINADRSVIWAPDTSTSPMPTVITNGSNGCCSDSVFLGTIFVPDQGISYSTNQAMEDVGSVYCGQWDVQSGNHPNPMVTYDAGAAAYVVSGMRLAE
jgi:type II secretory pathway pseudopilin PulG